MRLTSNLFPRMRTVFINLDAREFAGSGIGRVALRNRVRYQTKKMERYKRIRIASIPVTVSSVLWRTFVETNFETLLRIDQEVCHRSMSTSRESLLLIYY